MEKKKKVKSNSQSSLPVGSRGYVILVTILSIISVYVICMVIAIAPENPELAIGFLVSQSIWFVIVIVMLIRQIIYVNCLSLESKRLAAIL